MNILYRFAFVFIFLILRFAACSQDYENTITFSKATFYSYNYNTLENTCEGSDGEIDTIIVDAFTVSYPQVECENKELQAFLNKIFYEAISPGAYSEFLPEEKPLNYRCEYEIPIISIYDFSPPTIQGKLLSVNFIVNAFDCCGESNEYHVITPLTIDLVEHKTLLLQDIIKPELLDLFSNRYEKTATSEKPLIKQSFGINTNNIIIYKSLINGENISDMPVEISLTDDQNWFTSEFLSLFQDTN